MPTDTSPLWEQLPVAAVVILAIILVVREVVGALLQVIDKRNGKGNSKVTPMICPFSTDQFEEMCQQLRELYVWHSLKDEDGVFKWFIRKSLYSRVDDLVVLVGKQSTISNELSGALSRLDSRVRELGNQVERLDDRLKR